MTTLPEFFTLAALGLRWGLSASSLRRRIRQGRLPVSRPAGKLLVPADAVEAAERPVTKVCPARIKTLDVTSTTAAVSA